LLKEDGQKQEQLELILCLGDIHLLTNHSDTGTDEQFI